MKKFEYTAVDILGKEIRGKDEAETRKEVFDRLKKRSLFPTSINIIDGVQVQPVRPERPKIKYEHEDGTPGNAPENNDFVEESLNRSSYKNRFERSCDCACFFGVIVFIFLCFSVVIYADFRYRKWQIEKVVKQMVREECLIQEYKIKEK